MKIKLFLTLGLLGTIFSPMIQALDKNSAESFIRDNLLKDEKTARIEINGKKYRFFQSVKGSKGGGKVSNKKRIRCDFDGDIKTITQLLEDDNFKNWIKGQTFDPKGKWVGAKVVSDLASSNQNVNSSPVLKSSSRIYRHSLKSGILPNTNELSYQASLKVQNEALALRAAEIAEEKALRKATADTSKKIVAFEKKEAFAKFQNYLNVNQSQQVFYKKLIDGVPAKQPVLAIAENISTEGLKTATQATAQSTVNAFKEAAASTAAVTKPASSLGKMGKFAIPAVAVTGTAALAYNYGFKQKQSEQSVVEEKPLSYMAHMALVSKFCRKHPGTIVGIVATGVALGYGAYALCYNDEPATN